MTEGDPSDLQLELAHVLFIDIVGYSKKLIDEQTALVARLNDLVRGTEQFRKADAAGKLIRIPTGDGMALAFFTSPDSPVRCAIEINKADRGDPKIELRMGIHTGPVDTVSDVNERSNVAGAGINTAQRVMDCGDAGHILLSKRVADDLAQYGRWQSSLHDLGEVEVKHGVRLGIVNFYADDFGNPARPEKLSRADAARQTAAKADRQHSFRKRGVRIGIGAIVLALLGVAAFWFLERRAERTARERLGDIPAKSVAVLPFENLSQDPANAFFASGIQDEIITRLSKIAALKVISRTSTAQYGSKPGNLSQIAKELGVAAILEGSVQKVGNTIRVNVQLIKAATDAHLWADIYDRELIDILKVESDVATEIASSLRATLTPDEKERVERKPTNNSEAYALYLRALDAANRAIGSSAALEEAQHLCEQAIALDPQFALARARLSRAHSSIYQTYQPLETHKQGSKAEAEEALRLQPDLSEAHLAMGAYFGRVERDYVKALKEYEIAAKATPNDSTVLTSTGFIRMRQGLFRQAIVDLERASTLDPRSSNIFDTLGNAYGFVDNWSAAERAKKRAAELTPGPSAGKFNEEMSWAWTYLALTGSFEKIDAVLASGSTDPKGDPAGLVAALRFSAFLVEHKFGEAERAITASPVTIFEQWNGPRVTKSYFLGVVAIAQGDMAKAKRLFESELQFARSELNESPDSANRHAQVGLICAYLGQKEEAISEGRLAVDLLPISKDAFEGPWLLYNLAEIYGRVGEQEQAIALIEKLLVTPGGVTVAELKRDFQWDPLRQNPRFQKILAGPQPKVIYQ